MKGYRTIQMAIKALRRSPMRAMLTTLGIVIGVGAVIAMMEIGAGSSGAIRKAISSMGANVLNIRPGAASSGGVTFGAGSVTTLSPGDCEAILRECPAIRNASPLVHTRAQVVYGSRNWVPTFIYGVTPAYLGVQNWTMDEGETLHRSGRSQRQQGLRAGQDSGARAVSRRVAIRKRDSHQERCLPGCGRAPRQRRQHDGHGPGRHHPGAMDHDQIPRDGCHA